MKADKVLINGKIFSINESNERTIGTAVAIVGEKIAAVGTDEEIGASIGPSSQIIDCGGNTILPGLCDAHCHPSWTASFYLSCDLFNVFYDAGETPDDIIQKYVARVKQYIENHEDYQIVHGIGWNLAHFNGCRGTTRMPTRHDLDKICDDKPLILESYCQHNLWCNTKAIEAAGISAATPEPETGVIFRESGGFPEGVFQQMSAMNLIKEGIPGYDYTVEDYKNTIRRYQKEMANSYGVTMFQDCYCSENAKQAYYELARDKELTVRIRGVHMLDAQTKEHDFADMISNKDKYDAGDLFQINTAKFFLEGDFAMLSPYELEVLDALGLPHDYVAQPLWSMEDTVKYMARAMDEGYQIHCHAMGDASIKLAVDAIESARKKAKLPGFRDVIAHVMAIPEGYFKKMGRMKLICAAQPRWSIWDTDVEDFYIPYAGKERALRFYPIGQFTKAGCVVAYGTDFPVTPPPNPYHELQCAITRSVFKDAPDYERFKGKVLGPEENPCIDCVSLEEAVKSLTWNGAYQLMIEQEAGSVEVGKSADLVVLTGDMENTPADELYDLKVALTLFKGAIVYEK
jgi:predicted amidohydrolase YtcJ